MRNPMNDDDYTSNDEQIQDLKELVERFQWAAQLVVDSWEGGDLAGAVRELDEVLQDCETSDSDEEPAEETDIEPLCTCGHTLADHEHPDGNHQGCRKNVGGFTCACDGYEEARA